MNKITGIRNQIVNLFIRCNLFLLNLVLWPVNLWMKLLVKLQEACFSLNYDYLEKNNLLSSVLDNYMMKKSQPYFDRIDQYNNKKPITYMDGQNIKYTDNQNEVDQKQLQDLIDQLKSQNENIMFDLFGNNLVEEETECPEVLGEDILDEENESQEISEEDTIKTSNNKDN